MRSSVAQFAFALLTLFLGASAEEMLPKFLGVGFPMLLVAVQFFAFRRSLLVAVLFAVAAGGIEDAISSLPAMTSISYFLVVVALSRLSGMPTTTTLLTYPMYQIWLLLWVSSLGGGIFNRILLALPMGMVTAIVVVVAMGWTERKAAIDEEG